MKDCVFAAIDVGSNALRMRIADGDLRAIDARRASIRLGRDTFHLGRLTDRTIDDAVEALADFRKAMDKSDVTEYRAVATSATRDARNGTALVSRAFHRAGIELDIIGGAEEARLVRLAVSEEVSLRARSVLVDVGGGSTEVTLVHQSRPIYSRSLPIGAVRMLIEHRDHRAMKDAADLAAAQIGRRLGRQQRMIATGGNARALVRLCGHEGVIELEELRDTVRSMRRMTPLERVRHYGLRADRADTIVPAGVIFIRIALALGAKSILAPEVGLRDGILAELGAAARRRAA